MARQVHAGFAIASLLLAAAGPAWAEYEPDPNFFNCTNASGYYDVAATNDWRTRLQTSEPAAMQEVSGKWYAEFPIPENGGVYNNVITYSATGSMEFTTRTCAIALGLQRCVDDYGYGRFTAHRDQSGWIFIARNMTSQTRINACGGAYYRLENGVLIDGGGTRWQVAP